VILETAGRLMMTDTPRDILGKPIARLRDLAYNLRWSWDPATQALFRRIDPALWEGSRHNPVRVLLECDATRLDVLARDAAYVMDVQARAAELDAYLAA
jgi:glycogen phosphorylase